MRNWLQEFRDLFPEATERYTGRRQRLDRVEKAVFLARSLGRLEPETARAIEESEDWDYPSWWPRMSHLIDSPVEIPSRLIEGGDRRQLIKKLFDRLHHIEVVSVLLRFLYPEICGIMSPPVLSFLHLAPQPDSVDYYERYLGVLAKLQERYGLSRAADVDMALWAAAHLYSEQEFAGLVEDMRSDEYFQEMLLENMIQGWGVVAGKTRKSHLILAGIFLKHDYVLASLITARLYEEALLALGRRLGVGSGIQKVGQSKIAALKDRLKRAPELQRMEILPQELDEWWGLRCDAVHPDRRITMKGAERFVGGVQRFYRLAALD